MWARFPIVALSLVLYGAGSGVYYIARGTLPLALFGPERYAPLMGRLARLSLLAQALAPSLGGVILTHAGTSATLALLVGLAVGNVALVGALWKTAYAPSPAAPAP